MKKVSVGDQVVVRTVGDFYGYVGTVIRISQHGKHSRPHIWVTFDDHPWQKNPGDKWAFVMEELRLATATH